MLTTKRFEFYLGMVLKMKNSVRKTFVTIVSIATIIMFFALVSFAIHGFKDKGTHMEYERTLIAENGKMLTIDWEYELDVAFEGKYTVSAKWEGANPSSRIITALSFIDEDGNVLYYVTGDTVDSTSELLELTEGKYTLKFQCFANDNDFHEFVNSHENSTITNDRGSFAANGMSSTNFVISVYQDNKSVISTFILMAGCLGILIGTLLRLGVLRGSGYKSEFDERQQAIIGKAYRAGFTFMAIYLGLFAFLDSSKIELPAEDYIVDLTGIMLGLVIVATITIWNDGYFALNEKKKTTIGVLIAATVINIVTGINNFLQGSVIVDGKLSFGAINFICVIGLTYILIVLLVKSIKDKSEEEE